MVEVFKNSMLWIVNKKRFWSKKTKKRFKLPWWYMLNCHGSILSVALAINFKLVIVIMKKIPTPSVLLKSAHFNMVLLQMATLGEKYSLTHENFRNVKCSHGKLRKKISKKLGKSNQHFYFHAKAMF